MRQPNYKLDWFIPNQIAALTHFHPEVTQEDFMGVIQTGQELLAHVSDTFHVLIDNRFVQMESPASLSQMKQMVPYMSHPSLRWVVVVKSEVLSLDTSALPVEQDGQTQLKNVSTLAEAISFLREIAADLHWEKADTTFFPNIVIEE